MGIVTYLMENFNYYNKPEGQDLTGKVVGLSTWGFVTGSIFGLHDAVLKSHIIAVHKPLHIPAFLNTMGYWIIPLTGMCVAYSTVTYMATSLVPKSENFHINLILGALAAGGVLHAWQKDPMISGYGTAFLIILAILKRQTKDSNLKSKNLVCAEQEVIGWNFPWRNVPYRNYNKGTERWAFDREDYYKNF